MSDTIEIKRPDVVRDIRELAERTGKPEVEAVADAVRARLAHGRTDARTPEQDAELSAILARIDALPRVGEPLTDADLYDDRGLPR